MRYLIFILFLLVAFCACEEEIDAYAGKCGIYFDTKDMRLDTVTVSWGLKNSELKEQSLMLKVCLFGDVAPYDRKFSIDVISDLEDTLRAIEGVDYRPFSVEYTLPALQAETTINIQLLRTEILQKEARRFTVRLKETAELQFLYSRQWQEDSVTTRLLDIQRVVYMDENFPMPRWWYMLGPSVFGDYSVKKSIVICDVMGIDRETWALGNLASDLSEGYLKYVGKYMHRWLQEHPTEDENDELMEMGPASRN